MQTLSETITSPKTKTLFFMNECWFFSDHFRCGFFTRKPPPDEQQPLTEEEKAAASAGNVAPGEPTQEELMNLQEPMEMD